MPISRSPSRSDPESAVSEVIGFLLVFAILAIVLVLSMFAFGVIHNRAKSSVVTLQAESVAQRVASATVDAALFGEGHTVATSRYHIVLDLPERLEGRAYEVFLDETAEEVRVEVPSLGITAKAPIFSAGAGTNVNLCSNVAGIPGGTMSVRFGPNPTECVYLEDSP